MKASIIASNPSAIELRVEATATLGEWEEIMRRIEKADSIFYGPLNDLLIPIRNGVLAIRKREEISGQS